MCGVRYLIGSPLSSTCRFQPFNFFCFLQNAFGPPLRALLFPFLETFFSALFLNNPILFSTSQLELYFLRKSFLAYPQAHYGLPATNTQPLHFTFRFTGQMSPTFTIAHKGVQVKWIITKSILPKSMGGGTRVKESCQSLLESIFLSKP